MSQLIWKELRKKKEEKGEEQKKEWKSVILVDTNNNYNKILSATFFPPTTSFHPPLEWMGNCGTREESAVISNAQGSFSLSLSFRSTLLLHHHQFFQIQIKFNFN